MTKSVLAHLVGLAIAAGDLHPQDRVVDHVPELAGSGYAGCTLDQVLTMTTGVDWVEDHRDPNGPARRLIGCFADGRPSRRAFATGASALGLIVAGGVVSRVALPHAPDSYRAMLNY